jgi:putative chitinase
MKLEPDELRSLFPTAPSGVLMAAFEPLRQNLVRGDITTVLRQAAFLANIGHECRDLTISRENMNYSPLRLMQVWPSRFPSVWKATQYAWQPQKLANYVYAHRLGNGPPASGDGWRFRGGGWLQTTGRSNYAEVGLENTPELIVRPEHSARAAVTFWANRNLNSQADLGEPGFLGLCKRINGGLNGYEDRLRRYRLALSILRD